MGKKICTGNTRISLWDLYRQYYKSKTLKEPSWQRHYVWDKSMENSWIETIETAINGNGTTDIPGTLLMFEIEGKEGYKFLNDGLNRTTCTARWVEKKIKENSQNEAYKEYIETSLSKIGIFYQLWIYEDEADAFIDYMRANCGALPTPKELGQGVFAIELRENYSYWSDYLDRVLETVNFGLSRIGCKVSQTRERKHKTTRDSYAIFHRFLTKDKRQSGYEAGKSRLTFPKGISDPTKFEEMVEYKLAQILKTFTQEDAEKELEKFRSFIENESALYQSIWKKIIPDVSLSPPDTHVRWIFHVASYRRNNGIPLPKYEEFLSKLIIKTRGQTTVYPDDTSTSKTSHANMGLSKLSILGNVCRILEITDFVDPLKRKKKKPLSPGYDHSHIKPFSVNGEGETFGEPSLLNCSRGAKEILSGESNLLHGCPAS